jgi:hypothetical protein
MNSPPPRKAKDRCPKPQEKETQNEDFRDIYGLQRWQNCSDQKNVKYILK